MDLDFTPEQQLLRETVRGVCARHCGLDVVRQLEDDPIGYPEKLWVQLAELGLLDRDLSMLDLAIVHQELGRALAPSPAFVSAVMAAGALQRAGHEDLLPAIAAGDTSGTRAGIAPGRRP